MYGDAITIAMRIVLAIAAFVAAFVVRSLHRRSADPNPIPWAFFGLGLVVYSAALVALLVGSTATVSDWWRPAFSTLNLNLIVGSVWTLRRAVRHGW